MKESSEPSATELDLEVPMACCQVGSVVVHQKKIKKISNWG
jgi:hypothetical protein